MLQIDQIKALVAEGLHVYRGTPKGADYRVVWMNEAIHYLDGQPHLAHSHPADETGEDWRQVEMPDFDPAIYKLHSDNHHYGGHFHKMGCFECEQPVVTKVVKFINPRPPRPGYHSLNHYVVIESIEPLSDEDACERAIDLVLALNAGFDETTAQPALVI